jgi:small subunit ribosomal protein S16
MAVTIRLARHGKKSQPHYYVIVQDKEKSPKGGFIEKLGYYKPYTNPATIEIDMVKAAEWIKQGAKPSDRVGKLLEIVKNGGPKEKPVKNKKFAGKFVKEEVKKEEPKAEEKAKEEVKEEKVAE